jgi:hypothetical protein
MTPEAAAWVAGYRLGRDGKPPAMSIDMLEHELAAVEGDNSPSDETFKNYDWLWHLMGWSVGQEVGAYHLGKL